MTIKGSKMMQDSLNQIMTSAHARKESLMAKVKENRKFSGTGSDAWSTPLQGPTFNL
jgi:hypothetical protein